MAAMRRKERSGPGIRILDRVIGAEELWACAGTAGVFCPSAPSPRKQTPTRPIAREPAKQETDFIDKGPTTLLESSAAATATKKAGSASAEALAPSRHAPES